MIGEDGIKIEVFIFPLAGNALELVGKYIMSIMQFVLSHCLIDYSWTMGRAEDVLRYLVRHNKDSLIKV